MYTYFLPSIFSFITRANSPKSHLPSSGFPSGGNSVGKGFWGPELEKKFHLAKPTIRPEGKVAFMKRVSGSVFQTWQRWAAEASRFGGPTTKSMRGDFMKARAPM